MSGGSSRRYPPELRERAVRMVVEISGQHDSEWAAISEVAGSTSTAAISQPVEMEVAYYARSQRPAAG